MLLYTTDETVIGIRSFVGTGHAFEARVFGDSEREREGEEEDEEEGEDKKKKTKGKRGEREGEREKKKEECKPPEKL